MPGIYPPPKDTLKNWRKIIPYCKMFKIYIDDDFYIDSMKYFLIWDDENEILHCIRSNNVYDVQTIAPYMIRHVPYSQFEWFFYELA